jgi:hypothetical protein
VDPIGLHPPLYQLNKRFEPTHYIALAQTVAVQLLLSNGMLYSIVVCAAIGMDCVENTIPLLLFIGPCLVMAICCGSTILASSKYATMCKNIIVSCVCEFPTLDPKYYEIYPYCYGDVQMLRLEFLDAIEILIASIFAVFQV